MVALGKSRRAIATDPGISHPAVSQQLEFAPELVQVHPELLLDAAAPLFEVLAAEPGYGKLAVVGSVARGQAPADSDIDRLVEPPH
ncbi:MAG: Cro/Cl family transcriptional regulator, partial [Micrococcales bacterium]